MKKIASFIMSMTLFVNCGTNNDSSKEEICDAPKSQVEKNENIMKSTNLYQDSLTPIQRSCVEKVFKFRSLPEFEDVPYSAWDAKGYLSKEEKEALIQLSLLDFNKIYKPVDDNTFFSRFRKIFGKDFDLKLRQSTTEMFVCFSNPEVYYHVLKKERIIVDSHNYGIGFMQFDDVNSVVPYSRIACVTLGSLDDPIYVKGSDYLFHLNNYLFNENGASRTWLIINDKYFMSHLLLDFGYDGDKDINKMVLKENKRKNMEIIDVPLSSFHIYPDGKLKILDNLLNTAAELSTADTSDYFSWATSVIDSFCVYSRRSGFELNDAQNDSENSYDYASQIKNLTLSQRRELVAHIVNYMQPVYEMYLGTDMGYGNVDSDLGDMRILDCFWNYMMGDHEVIAEIEDNNYYGLSNLQALIEKMKEFKPFYNSKTGAFEPWAYVPLRYQTLEEN